MPARLKLILAYDGREFDGWQSQSSRNAVQDHVERAFYHVIGECLRVHGAGRTDAGVHALAQCAHVDLSARRFTPAKWTAALNANLPHSVRVMRCAYIDQKFHARYSAKGKVYRYRIWAAPVLPPLERGRAWHISGNLDVRVLKSAAEKFVGRHDFAGFAANRGKTESTTVRTITAVRVRKQGAAVSIDVEGEGFLYKMVRMMVAAMVQCAQGKLNLAELSARLKTGRAAASRSVAPAEGLFLVAVRY